MIYVNFHKSSIPGEFSGGNSLAGVYHLSPNTSETTWNFQMQLTKMIVDSMKMIYIYFHSPNCSRDFSDCREFRGLLMPIFIHNILRGKKDNKTMTSLWIKVSVQDFEWDGGRGRILQAVLILYSFWSNFIFVIKKR